MSFSAATCITSGFEDLGPVLNLYSNNSTTPFGTVNTSEITEPNCPYIIENIPMGTTQITFQDPVSLCCGSIAVNTTNSCEFCDLSFNTYQTTTNGILVVGNLISSCDSNITDYIIKWYKVGEEEVVFTSGLGTEFSDIGYDLTHPLIGAQSPLVEPGQYYPVLDRVIINGIVFTNDGDPGTIQANLDCFRGDLITVNRIICGQGNNSGPYSHFYQFSNYSVGTPPIGLSTEFEISSSINYIAFNFRAGQIYDNLKLVFYGSQYNYEPIIIENVLVGSELSGTNVNPNVFPKTIKSGEFIKKVICLTAFTINNGDYVKISVIPNQVNNNTIWDLYFDCLESFDCTTCIDSYLNTTPKIVSSSLSVVESDCDIVNITWDYYPICGFSEFLQCDVGDYFYGYENSINTQYQGPTFSPSFYWSNISCNSGLLCSAYYNYLCGPQGGVYTVNKTINNQGNGVLNFTFNEFSDLVYYYTSYTEVYTCLSNGAVNNNQSIDYYRYFQLLLPQIQNPNEICGDTTEFQLIYMHYTSTVSTGGTGPYTMQIVMPTIQENTNFTTCDLYCDSVIANAVNTVNNSILSNFTNFTTNTGCKFQNPFRQGSRAASGSTSQTSRNGIYRATFGQFQNETYAYSGINNTIIPNLSGLTCQWKGEKSINSNTFLYSQNVFQVRLELTNQNNVSDFQILIKPNTNFILSPTYVTALTYSNGVITYSSSTYVM